MAGHSKWKNIQHRKGAQDKKKAKLFTRVLKEVHVAVKMFGPDPESNPRLKLAMQNARGVNLPKDTLERAIKKASGEGGEKMQEVLFESYGIDGVALFIECATENNTRTVANIRSYFSKHGGAIGKEGCLQFVFEQKGVFTLNEVDLSSKITSPDDFTLELIDHGAQDIDWGEVIEVTCQKEDFGSLQKFFESKGITPQSAQLERIAVNTKSVTFDTYQKIMKLIEVIEEDEDVQNVYHNIELSDELQKAIESDAS